MPLFGTTAAHYFWLTTSYEGMSAATATWALHLFCWTTTARFVVGPRLGLLSKEFLAYTLLFDLSLLSHTRAMLTEPGVVPPGAVPPPADRAIYEEVGGFRKVKGRWCSECSGFKPRKAHHNFTTGRCVVKLDHWCPWVSNAVRGKIGCPSEKWDGHSFVFFLFLAPYHALLSALKVGIRNHKHFLLFCVYHCTGCAFGIYLIVTWLSSCAERRLLSVKLLKALHALNRLVHLQVSKHSCARFKTRSLVPVEHVCAPFGFRGLATQTPIGSAPQRCSTTTQLFFPSFLRGAAMGPASLSSCSSSLSRFSAPSHFG